MQLYVFIVENLVTPLILYVKYLPYIK